MTPCGFPHSDMCGSPIVCISPHLFAAYHVFLRLSVPRHSPCALFSLTSSWKILILISFQACLKTYEVQLHCHPFTSFTLPRGNFADLSANLPKLNCEAILLHFHSHYQRDFFAPLQFFDNFTQNLILQNFVCLYSVFKVQLGVPFPPFRKVVGSNGFEPSTSRLSGARSNQLSYEPILVEMRRFELLTPCVQGRCSPS